MRWRLTATVVAALVAIGTVAGVAVAKTRAPLVGTGVVVIDTDLGYQDGEAAGTGMVLTSSGEILTNNHVIRGATTIKIVVPGLRHIYAARVVGYDVTDDVAVLQATGATNLKTVTVGNSGAVKVGQTVTAVGNAGGTGTLTSSTGAITGLARSITVSDDNGNTEQLSGLIETNAGLMPGDSGGPLFSTVKKVVGMDTAASVSGYGFQQTASSVGYAIPIAKAVRIAKAIAAGKASATIHIGSTAFLGVSVSSSGYDTAGAMIAGVVDGGAAASAGLVAGDVITSFAGQTVASAAALGTLVAAEQAGSTVSVTYLDPTGVSQTVDVTLGSGPPQ
ncbi:MAG TPA: trypsin-like peptidase domain-containing protein [Gaiellaceae bacterium]|jgi:S1-C subfamily serine protease|nr:trypsin-like peptidase domain-containing protein [Gaiellaceae bacterium]